VVDSRATREPGSDLDAHRASATPRALSTYRINELPRTTTKPYQVRQVLELVERYGLELEERE
jgi:hypothetical protein